MRRRSLAAILTFLALAVPLFATAATVSSLPAGAAEVSPVRINEVESNGDEFDWVELVNTGTEPVDVSGWVVKDDKDDRALALPAGSTIAAGEYLAIDVNDDANPEGFGLGKADTARLFADDGVTVIDAFAWDGHAAVTYGRCADGTGEFRDTVASTKGAANACEITPAAAVRINEIESNGDASDWIELTNISAFTVDVSGLVLKDDNDSRTDAIADGTTIEPGAFLAVEPSFGLGGGDSARIFDTDGTTLIDGYAWEAHATTSYGRCPDGIGDFATTNSTTRGAANDCVAAIIPDVRINEIESNGDATDWVELFNGGSNAVDISNWVIHDNDDSHVARIPADTVLAAGGYFVFDQPALSFGLDTSDSVRVFAADGFTAIDSRSWSGHSPTTLGVCGSEFVDTTSSTKGSVNDCSAPIRINEVESSGDSSDWVELKNNGADSVDVSGLILKDNDDSHAFTLAAGTTIAAGDYLVVEPDFGLGGGDSARLFEAGGVTLLDSYSWTSHAATTYARCPDGTGEFETSKSSTKGAANSCVGDLETAPWPGATSVSTVNEKDAFSDNMSGLAFEAADSGDVLWAAKNGPGALYKLVFDGANWVPALSDSWNAGKLLHYSDGTGDVDAEGVALTEAGASGGVFIASERDNANSGVSRPTILRYDVSDAASELIASHEWNLTADLPVVAANAGLEGIAWIPDGYLVAEGFVDESTNALYNPSTYSGHGDGLFFVGLEANGAIYAYALDQNSGAFQRVATIESGFSSVMELEFDPSLGGLWAVCDDTCNGRSALLEIAQNGAAGGSFEVTTVFERPTGMPNINNEGFAVSAQSECAAGSKPVYWSDDSNTDGFALRAGTIDCTTTTDPTNPTDPTDPTGPSAPVAIPAADLLDSNRGAVFGPASARPGDTITIVVGAALAGDVVNTWIYSTPTLLGSPTVSAAGAVTATIPTTITPGSHRLVVTAADGSLIGWTTITIAAAGEGSLAFTGSSNALPLQLALMLVIAGMALLVLRRRPDSSSIVKLV